jgi:hypothetical protein
MNLEGANLASLVPLQPLPEVVRGHARGLPWRCGETGPEGPAQQRPQPGRACRNGATTCGTTSRCLRIALGTPLALALTGGALAMPGNHSKRVPWAARVRQAGDTGAFFFARASCCSPCACQVLYHPPPQCPRSRGGVAVACIAMRPASLVPAGCALGGRHHALGVRSKRGRGPVYSHPFPRPFPVSHHPARAVGRGMAPCAAGC